MKKLLSITLLLLLAAILTLPGSAASVKAYPNPQSWNSLSKQQKQAVNKLMTTLDNYNNRFLGPAHCSQ